MSKLARISGIYPLIDDDPRWSWKPDGQLLGALAGGARVVQLRFKHSTDSQILDFCRFAKAECTRAGTLLFVNDRYDLADLGGADGVHLGQDDPDPESIPAELRARLLVGLSTHDQEQVQASRTRPVDYIAFGPVFGTRSKESEYDARGIERLREAVGRAAHPLVAIGGIDDDNLEAVRDCGVAAAAVISVIANAADPTSATRELQTRFTPPPGA